MHMSALGLPGYHLHAAYAGDWQLSPTEVRTPHTWVISLKAHLRDSGLEEEEMCVLWGRVCRAPASLPFLWMGGREESFMRGAGVCLCGSTRGRWVLLKKS